MFPVAFSDMAKPDLSSVTSPLISSPNCVQLASCVVLFDPLVLFEPTMANGSITIS